MEKITESILKFLKLDSLVNNLTGYVEARINLMKVEIREDVSKAISQGMVMVALFFMGFLFLVFFSIGLAQFLNTFFEYTYAGYWIVAGIYGSIFLILLLFKKNISAYFEAQFSELMQRKEK
ncbi:MAG TPA: phage holin family protein [Cyclobacteriaceae bacterium]|nr:phage holin family protein [Cyclobacteriaceae bacterium]